MKQEELKPTIDRYEIILFFIIVTISTFASIVEYESLRPPFWGLIPILLIVLVIMFFIYHKTRENKWKKSVTNTNTSTLQNNSLEVLISKYDHSGQLQA